MIAMQEPRLELMIDTENQWQPSLTPDTLPPEKYLADQALL
jgi:hypothetical protein